MIRPATIRDRDTLLTFWKAFELEYPEPEYMIESEEQAWADIENHIDEGVALVAEEDGRALGMALARVEEGRKLGHFTGLYVLPEARRRGIGRTLMAEVETRMRERGVEHLSLDVLVANEHARRLHRRLGYAEHALLMIKSLAEREEADSTGWVFVQTDDVGAVQHMLERYLPRIRAGGLEDVEVAPQTGWIRVRDEACARDPKLLRRLGRELSDSLGGVVLTLGLEAGAVVRYVLLDRGGVADEYASVPEFFGTLPPGDVVALAANPTVAQRLTGADPAELRSAARTANAIEDLPPPQQLLEQVAGALKVEL